MAERMRRYRQEKKKAQESGELEPDEVARLSSEVKVLQEKLRICLHRLRVQRVQRLAKRGCQAESLAASVLEPLVAELVAEPVAEPSTPQKEAVKRERSPNLSSGNGREKSGKPQAPNTSSSLPPRQILNGPSPPRSPLRSPPRSSPERPIKESPPRSSPSPLAAFDFLKTLEKVSARGPHCASHCACAVFSRKVRKVCVCVCGAGVAALGDQVGGQPHCVGAQ